jgi:hypothetical protein
MVNLARRVNIEKREGKGREVSQKDEEGSVLGLGVGFIKKKEEKRKEAKEGPTVSETVIKKKSKKGKEK